MDNLSINYTNPSDDNHNKSSNSNLFSTFRLPEKRKTIEDMSIQDWMQRVHRLKTHNSKLETDLETLQTAYDQLYNQKENIRKKAKELTEAVSGIYVKYDELEKAVMNKDEEINRLNQRIRFFETQFMMKNRADNGNQHNHGQEPQVQNLFLFSPDRSFSQEDKMNEFSQLLLEAQDRERTMLEENSKLKARILELEGILSGTLYHNAYKNTPHRPTTKEILNSSPEKSHHFARENIQKLVNALQTAALPPSQSATPIRPNFSSPLHLSTSSLSSSHLLSPPILPEPGRKEEVDEVHQEHTDRLIFSPPAQPNSDTLQNTGANTLNESSPQLSPIQQNKNNGNGNNDNSSNNHQNNNNNNNNSSNKKKAAKKR